MLQTNQTRIAFTSTRRRFPHADRLPTLHIVLPFASAFLFSSYRNDTHPFLPFLFLPSTTPTGSARVSISYGTGARQRRIHGGCTKIISVILFAHECISDAVRKCEDVLLRDGGLTVFFSLNLHMRLHFLHGLSCTHIVHAHTLSRGIPPRLSVAQRMYGVFDGHGGRYCSQFVVDNLKETYAKFSPVFRPSPLLNPNL